MIQRLELPLLTERQAIQISKDLDAIKETMMMAMVALQIPSFDMQANSIANSDYATNMSALIVDLERVAKNLERLTGLAREMGQRTEAGIGPTTV